MLQQYWGKINKNNQKCRASYEEDLQNASLDKQSKFTFSNIQLIFLNLTTRRMEIYIQVFRKGTERV